MKSISITSTPLYFHKGNSDKEYHVAVKPCGEGYIVDYAYGRRGSNLTTGTKTPHIVTLAQANAIHNKLVREKSANGYHPTGDSSSPSRTPFVKPSNTSRMMSSSTARPWATRSTPSTCWKSKATTSVSAVIWIVSQG